MITIYSVLHFLVDAVCAYAMFGRFGNAGVYAYLLYNLCAFVLQLPIGAVIDLITMKLDEAAAKRFNRGITSIGVIITLVGMYAGTYVLGIGNAIFHSGGGVRCIKEDRTKQLNGKGLGIFVAPGALGLFVGKLLTSYDSYRVYIQIALIVVAIIGLLCAYLRSNYETRRSQQDCEIRRPQPDYETRYSQHTGSDIAVVGSVEDKFKASGCSVLFAVLCCFLVVILRSYVGLAMKFDWKSRLVMSFLAVAAVALGKAAGGFAAAKAGRVRTICISLGLAGIAFYFSHMAVGGLLALFFFNMTMPITLHMMTEVLPDTPGIAFGTLSLGLFIGFLPVYFDVSLPVSGVWIGVAGSLISLGILLLPILTAVKKQVGKK